MILQMHYQFPGKGAIIYHFTEKLAMNSAQKQELKAKAHHLKAVILVGAKGLTPALVKETDNAIEVHELIKVKLNGIEKEDKLPFINALCAEVRAELVQLLGSIAILYRKKIPR